MASRTPPASGSAHSDDLPLSDPFPEYLACPDCGEPEVETWSDHSGAPCPVCGTWVARPGSGAVGDPGS